MALTLFYYAVLFNSDAFEKVETADLLFLGFWFFYFHLRPLNNFHHLFNLRLFCHFFYLVKLRCFFLFNRLRLNEIRLSQLKLIKILIF